MEGKVIGGDGYKFSIMNVVYPCGMFSFSSLGSFLSVVSYYKTSHPAIPLYLGLQHMQEYFNNKRGRKQKYIKTQE